MTPPKQRSWFFNWILNNRLVSTLLITLLILLNLLLLSKVPWLFKPIISLIGIIGGPILIAGVLYYLLVPVVDWLEQRFHLRRGWSTIGIFLIILLLIVIGVVAIIPVIQTQITELIQNWPKYWQHGSRAISNIINEPSLAGIKDQVMKFNDEVNQQIGSFSSSIAKNTLSSVGSVLSGITTTILALVTAPFILFYLLKDGHKLPDYLAHFFPQKHQESVKRILGAMNDQVSRYIRGQLIVAFLVAVMFYVGFLIIGLKYALLLGIAAGILNLVPYLGSFLAMVPAVLVGAFVSPWMLVKVLIVFVIEQTIEGRLISPLVLGNTLKIHPVTIIFILLASGKLFGVLGVILGIPGYAVLRVVFTEIFDWIRDHSAVYQNDDKKDASSSQE